MICRMRLARSVFAFVALPGIVAYALPAWLVYSGRGLAAASDAAGVSGLLLLGAGSAVLLWCVVAFHRRGRGTLAPWSPPQRLVTSGLYAYSRNPMYLGVLLVLAGWTLFARSPLLAAYGLVVALAFHLRVVFAEEPALERAFGDEWRSYRACTPRWLGRPRRR